MATGTTDDATAALEAAIAGTDADSTTAQETTESTKVETTTTTADDGDKKQSQTVPYDRFKEVNEKSKAAIGKIEALEAQLAESQASLTKLTDLVNEKESDSDLVRRIQALAADDKYREHVLAIDNKLKGIEIEEEKGEITPEQADAKTRKLVEDTRDELQAALAEQQADAILARADIIADKLLDSLPEEYTDKDKEVIADLWTNITDWDKIEQSPDELSGFLSESFQTSLEKFGKPRGGLVTNETTETTKETTATLTPEEELRQLVDKDYGKTVEKDGKVESELSDAEFSAAMAKAMKITNG